MTDTTIKTQAFGSWRSPINAEFVVSNTVGLSSIRVDGDDIYWIESRPEEGGRSAIVALREGAISYDIISAPFNARSRAHEYGGGAYTVSGATVYFSNFSDNGIYFVRPGGLPELLLSSPALRFADFVFSPEGQALFAVCEDHTDEGKEPVNTLVRIDLLTKHIRTIVSGADFYASPRVSPDGKQLVWLTWDHPNMPWDGTSLWVAEIVSSGGLSEAVQIAGGVSESVFQPEWSPNGDLYFVSDRSGWWNIYRHTERGALCLWARNAEFGLPQWVFGLSTYAFVSPSTIFCVYSESGLWNAAVIDCYTLRITKLSLPFTTMNSVTASSGKALLVGGSFDKPDGIYAVDPTTAALEQLKVSTADEVPSEFVSRPQQIDFPTGNEKAAHLIYYPPTNGSLRGLPGELPPLLLSCHGGPTDATYPAFNRTVLFWTSRGFAFAYVNYGGSCGYGREYRKRLDHKWGDVDVQDCVNAAKYLADQGLADRHRLTIHGGSAGGYVALAALTFYDLFAAGASLYGISNLESLALDTHKFESRYMDSLVGPYPEARDLYYARSPINFVDQLTRPVIFFQGADDKVVPPAQSERMSSALREKGIPVAYLLFEGEGHGFRKKHNIKRCLEAMLYFYSRNFGIALVDHIEPIDIGEKLS